MSTFQPTYFLEFSHLKTQELCKLFLQYWSVALLQADVVTWLRPGRMQGQTWGFNTSQLSLFWGNASPRGLLFLVLERSIIPTLRVCPAVGEHLLQPDSWIRIDETFTQQSRAVVVYGKRNCSLLWMWTCSSLIKNELGVCTWWLLWSKACPFSLHLKLSTWCSLWI